MKRQLSLVLLIFCSTMALSAQWMADGQVISALGLKANRSNVNVSSTLGEAVIFGRKDGPLRALQGFQRDRMSLLTNVFQINTPSIPSKVYPNPCREGFYLETAKPVSYLRCYSLDGRLMAHWPASEDRYVVSHLPKGIYILRARIALQELTLQTLIIQ
jgi:hypothetical protein